VEAFLQRLRDAREIAADVGWLKSPRLNPLHHQQSFTLPVLHDLGPGARLRGSDRIEELEMAIDVEDG
jgi:hypothetical protein